MASRPILSPFPVIVNGNMASTVISTVTVIQNTSFIGYDIAWTGSPTGTFIVQISNTYSQNADGSINNPGNWTPLTLSAPTTATGSAGMGFIDVRGCSAYAIRLQYVPSSGFGILNATAAGKVA